MRTRDEVTAEKLRGGFYSPEPLVDLCVHRVATLTRGRTSLRLLEPSAGDGAFIRGLGRHTGLRSRLTHVTALELLGAEAAKCHSAIQTSELQGEVITTSAISWASKSADLFDAAVGNPPFVRFQFVSAADSSAIRQLEQRLGLSFTGVSNLWLPVLLGALYRLRTGGAFCFIIPAESFTGISAGVLRRWLVQNAEDLRFDLFPPGSFPAVLQEVVVLSGRRKAFSDSFAECELRQHRTGAAILTSKYRIPPSTQPWTRYLLSKDQIEAFEAAAKLPAVWPMGHIAKFEVAAVTGANDYFSVDDATLEAFDLAEWSTPLLPRIRHAPGLRYTANDHSAAAASGAKTHLLDFSADRPDPTKNRLALKYLRTGEEDGLPDRYKCRIRSPWYRVPFIRSGRLMLSKRSHTRPRVVLNETGVVTTDTVYRGSMVGFFADREADLVASFHNSLTLLSAEIEGRSFGGGVLELVPTEVGRLLVPMPPDRWVELERLDSIARCAELSSSGDALVDETDGLLVKADIGIDQQMVDSLRAARHTLMRRRLDRNAAA